MEERKFIKLKKEEYGIKGYIKRDLGKGKISRLDIEYTPVGEKIVIHTSKPGLVIGRRGEKIEYLTDMLKRRFKLENPHIEIKEIENPLFDAQLVADEIALALERMGNLKFKVIAYRKLQEIMNAGALGCELRLTGKLPSDRSKSWRFADGYLKKAGEPSKEIDRAQSTALTKTGVIGIKAAIMPPDARIYDKIDVDEKMKLQIKSNIDKIEDKDKEEDKTSKKKKSGELKGIEKEKKGIKKDLEKTIKKEEKEEKEIVKKVVDKVEGKKESIGKGELEIAEKIAKEEEKIKEVKEKVEDELGKLDKEEGKVIDKVVEEELKDQEVGEYDQKIEDVVDTEIKPEESGTAIKIEQEVEEGVPQEMADRENRKEKEKVEEKDEKEKIEDSNGRDEEKDIKAENTNEVRG